MQPATATILTDPDFLPHRLVWQENRVEFVRTSRERLRDAAFLDGRSDFSVGAGASLPLDALREASAPGFERFIFHMAFCGSTLLARLLDGGGRAAVLREPQALVDLADLRATLDRAGRTAEPTPHLHAIRSLLSRRWSADEPVVVKPSNWANSLLAELCADPAAIRPLFLTIGRAAFLRAVFRGGPERLAYAARCAVHLSSAGAENAALLADALAREGAQADKLAGAAIVLHRIQREQFVRVASAGGWGAAQFLAHEALSADPRAALERAEAALDVALGSVEREASLARWADTHAKSDGRSFSAAEQAAREVAMLREHERTIAAALDWADSRLGPA